MDVTLYEFLLFAHLTFVAIWVGGDAMIQMFYVRAKMGGFEQQLRFSADVEWIGLRVITPTALLVAAFGVWLVLNSPAWEFSQAWVSVGLGLFLLSAITGAAFLGPESGRIATLGEERGAEDPEVQRRISRILLVSRIELVLLIAVILDMIAKPGL